MSQQITQYECISCPMSGCLGIAPVDQEIFDDYSACMEGYLLAHDLIEHVNGHEALGGVGDELEACTGIWLTRGVLHDIQRGKQHSIYSPEESVAHEVRACFEYWWGRGCAFDMPVPKPAPTIFFDQELREILTISRKLIVEERDSQWDDDDDGRPSNSHIAEYLLAAKHFMRSGWHKHKARWPDNDYQANNQFWAIAEATDAFCKTVEIEGQKFDLKWGDGEALMYETDEEDIYEYEDEED